MRRAAWLLYCKTNERQCPELRRSDGGSGSNPQGVAAMSKSTIMTDLMSVIVDRKNHPQAGKSYVTSLFNGGMVRIGEKIIEEAAEVVEAGAEPGDPGREHMVKEVADLVFHAMVLLGYRDCHWDDVEAELMRRSGIGGLAEKAARKGQSES